MKLNTVMDLFPERFILNVSHTMVTMIPQFCLTATVISTVLCPKLDSRSGLYMHEVDECKATTYNLYVEFEFNIPIYITCA